MKNVRNNLVRRLIAIIRELRRCDCECVCGAKEVTNVIG